MSGRGQKRRASSSNEGNNRSSKRPAPPIPDRDIPSRDLLEEAESEAESAAQQLREVGMMLELQGEPAQRPEEVPETPREAWSSGAASYPMTMAVNPPPPGHNFSERYPQPNPLEKEQIEIDLMIMRAGRMRKKADELEARARERQSTLRLNSLQSSFSGAVDRVVTPIRGALSDAAASARNTSENLLIPGLMRTSEMAANAVAGVGESVFNRAQERRISSLEDPTGQSPGQFSRNLTHAAALKKKKNSSNREMQSAGGSRRRSRRSARRSVRRSARRSARRSVRRSTRRSVKRNNRRSSRRRS